MALFQGEDMVDVQTPDGRTLTLPRSIVPSAMLPQQIAPGGPVTSPQEIPGGFTAPTFEPDPADAGYSVPGVVEMGEPDVTPVTVMDPMDVKARPAVMKRLKTDAVRADKAKAAQAASPMGKLATAQDGQMAAANAQAEAIDAAAIAQAAEDDVLAEAKAERNVQIDGMLAKRATDMQKVADEQEAKFSEVTSLKTKIAGFKVDRTHDSKTMASIGMILAALGTAINNTTYKRNDENPAIKIFLDAVDRKVAGQMADLDQMGKIYGMTQDEVAMLKEKSKSKLEMWNTMIAGETEKGIRIVEEIVARSASEKTKANAKMFIAQLQDRVAEKTMEATRWGLDFDQKDKHQKAQIGVQYAGIAESKRASMARDQLDREKMVLEAADRDIAMQAARGTAAAKEWSDAEKDARQYGIKGGDNEYLMTPAGRAQMALAASREAEAAALEASTPKLMDPRNVAATEERVQKLRQSAARLRGEARVTGVVKLRNDAVASRVPDAYAAGQNMIDVIDDIKLIGDQVGRGLIGKSVGQQQLDALYRLLAVKGKDAWQLGAWDKGSATLSKDIYGANPSEWNSTTLRGWVSDVLGDDPDGYKDRLEIVAKDIETGTRLKVQKHSDWDGKGELFSRKKLPDLTSTVGKATADLTQARDGADLSRTPTKSISEQAAEEARDRGYAPTKSISEQAAEGATNSGQSVKYPGLSVAQEAPFETLLTEYKKGGPGAARAGDQLVAEVVNTAEKRPDLAVPLLRTLKEHAPSLGTAARVALPKDSPAEKQMALEASNEIARAPVPTAEMATMIIATMNDDGTVTADAEYRALAKRAGAGDKAAKQALADIWNAGSKFKRGRPLPKRGGR